jgi:hypothetical protein
MSAALLVLALSMTGPDSGWVAGPDGVRLYYQKIGIPRHLGSQRALRRLPRSSAPRPGNRPGRGASA